MTDESEAPEEPEDVKTANRRRTNRALAARDHAAFSAMMYAGLRIEETDGPYARGSLLPARRRGGAGCEGQGQQRTARADGVPNSGKSLRRYLKAREDLVPVGGPAAQTPAPYLFLNEKGQRVTENTLRRRLYKWVRQSPIKKQDIKPHDLRRTFRHLVPAGQPGAVCGAGRAYGALGHFPGDEVRALRRSSGCGPGSRDSRGGTFARTEPARSVDRTG